MTMLAQYLAVGAIVVAALGYLLGRLRRRLHTKSQAKAAGCSACDQCPGCAPDGQEGLRFHAARNPRVR
jgi:hypothetical protein